MYRYMFIQVLPTYPLINHNKNNFIGKKVNKHTILFDKLVNSAFVINDSKHKNKIGR